MPRPDFPKTILEAGGEAVKRKLCKERREAIRWGRSAECKRQVARQEAIWNAIITTAKPNKVMTPKHRLWPKFIKRLEGPEGCNYWQKIPGKRSTLTWKCKGGTDKTFAGKILADMGMDVEASCAYFEQHGGFCDCEICMNVNPRAPLTKEQKRRITRRRAELCGRPKRKEGRCAS